ncbi:unnamed protein product, partial [Notodromas monacha]
MFKIASLVLMVVVVLAWNDDCVNVGDKYYCEDICEARYASYYNDEVIFVGRVLNLQCVLMRHLKKVTLTTQVWCRGTVTERVQKIVTPWWYCQGMDKTKTTSTSKTSVTVSTKTISTTPMTDYTTVDSSVVLEMSTEVSTSVSTMQTTISAPTSTVFVPGPVPEIPLVVEMNEPIERVMVTYEPKQSGHIWPFYLLIGLVIFCILLLAILSALIYLKWRPVREIVNSVEDTIRIYNPFFSDGAEEEEAGENRNVTYG